MKECIKELEEKVEQLESEKGDLVDGINECVDKLYKLI